MKKLRRNFVYILEKFWMVLQGSAHFRIGSLSISYQFAQSRVTWSKWGSRWEALIQHSSPLFLHLWVKSCIRLCLGQPEIDLSWQEDCEFRDFGQCSLTVRVCIYNSMYLTQFRLGQVRMRPSIYSDSQNYVYSGKFFLSRPVLQWKKKGEIWKNLFEFNKRVNIRKSILLDVK